MSYIRFLPLTSAAIVVIGLTSCNTSSQPPETKTTQITETTSSEAQDQDLEYMTTLGLMKGHLLVAKELLDEGKPEAAEPHIGHPVEELYTEIETQLPQRQVKEFKSTLNQLHDLVKTKPKSPEIVPQYQASLAAVDSAINAIPEDKRQSPEFTIEVMKNLLDVAESEYKAAIAGGKFVEVIEYQDSRGFVLYADLISQKISQQLPAEITTNLTELKKAWPSVNPPTQPLKTPEEVSQLIGKIQTN